jgi:hypothetical protein
MSQFTTDKQRVQSCQFDWASLMSAPSQKMALSKGYDQTDPKPQQRKNDDAGEKLIDLQQASGLQHERPDS